MLLSWSRGLVSCDQKDLAVLPSGPGMLPDKGLALSKERWPGFCIYASPFPLAVLRLGLQSTLELADVECQAQGSLGNTGQRSAPKILSIPETKIPEGSQLPPLRPGLLPFPKCLLCIKHFMTMSTACGAPTVCQLLCGALCMWHVQSFHSPSRVMLPNEKPEAQTLARVPQLVRCLSQNLSQGLLSPPPR